jgi:hypothetical protein
MAFFGRDMEACALVPAWSCEFNESSSQLQWREELMDFNALLTRESEYVFLARKVQNQFCSQRMLEPSDEMKTCLFE